MRGRLDEQLEELNIELIKMGGLCEKVITYALGSLEGESSYHEQVHVLEREIDEKERTIENLCLRLLLQQQPVAKDLRLVSAALKMISDMERIGDQACDIVDISRHLNGSQVRTMINLKEIANATIQMVTDSIDSFVKKDLVLAKKVIQDDDIVDQLFDKLKQELVDFIKDDNINSEYCLDLLMIAKYFERIGDHATNIAEWVEFSISGNHKESSLPK